MPRHGKIRLGKKGVKGQPQKIDAFRFTSGDKGAIQAIAELYGGEAKPWTDSPNKGEWEVFSDRAEIPVALPPDPLGGSPLYELWSGGGCLRRCDGEVCEVSQSGPDGPEVVETACLCVAADNMECKVTTRLTVILREVAFGGGWLLESHGWNAAHELPGMVDAVQAMQARGFVAAVLALEQRTKKVGGQTRRFVVPVVRPSVTLDALASGEGGVGLPRPALPLPTTELEAPALAEVEESLTCKLCGEVVKGWGQDELHKAALDHTEQFHQ